MSITPPTDQAINAWYESQPEETLRYLQDRFDAQTPRQAWQAFFTDCPPPAPQGPSDSLAAPAAAGQGVSTSLHQFHDRDDGLLHCMVCNGAEGSLPIECPGRRMTDSEQDAVYAGQLDFFNGIWDRRA